MDGLDEPDKGGGRVACIEWREVFYASNRITLSEVPKLSVSIIALNEARALPACLASVHFADEIVVVDSGSTDTTVEIAIAAGAKVIHEPWRGFGAQKQFAVEAATHDWVLCVDADERVTPQLREAIKAAVTERPERAEPDFQAYRFARANHFMGRVLRHGEGYPDWSLRLFNRKAARWSQDPVHEKVTVDARAQVGTLAGDLLHESADSLHDYIAKQNRYSTLAAERAIADGKSSGMLKLMVSPIMRFGRFYILKLGFLDGRAGLIHIAIGALASFLKHAKMIAGQQNSG